MTISDDELARLQLLSDAADAGPWTAMVEGRDHESGDDFIMVGVPGALGTDLYVWQDNRPAKDEILDLIAASRTYLPLLIKEVRELRSAQNR